MKLIKICLIAASVFTALPAAASLDLAKSKNCMSCHQVDKKSVGPAFKEVAAKYKGQGDAVGKLASKIQKGGAGVWGSIPMPPNPVTESEAKTLADWALKQ